MTPPRAQALVDVAAVTANVALLRDRAGAAGVLAVVKADGYGHGLLPCARAAVAGGAGWLGTALLEEALALRAAGLTGPRVLAWLLDPGDPFAAAVRADVDLSASAPWAVRAAADAARETGRPARLHLKVDSGLGRAGCPPADWAELVGTALAAAADGLVEVVGLWSHLAYADAPRHPTTDRQLDAFRAAVEVAERAGVRPEVRHLANSAATLTRPDTHFDLVRPGLAVYGLSPIPDEATPAELGLRPAMTLAARLALVKRVPAGHGVSYLHRYTTARETTLGLVPLGYADGIPRAATNGGPVLAAGRRRTVAGTVCMDQFVVDLGDDPAAEGDEVVLFGPGDRGEPTAEDWARAVGTISYEIVTRVGPRVPRVVVGA
ncbi:MAG: alanine racemase [Actinomycetia bacterium]|nr:alanine racemase [Actinomycetes bacterium]